MPVILAFVIAILLFVVLLKIVALLLALVVCAALGGFVYIAARRLIGSGR